MSGSDRGIRGYLRIVGRLMGSVWFFVPVVLVGVLGFGYILGHPTIAIDNTGEPFYFLGNGLLSQGRYSQVLLYGLFHLKSMSPITPVMGVVLLVLSAFFWGGLFSYASGGRLGRLGLLLFGALFVSYPLVAESFVYDLGFVFIALAYLLTPIGVVLALSVVNLRDWKAGLGVVFLMAFVLPLYESFAAVFIFGVLSCLILERLYGAERGRSLKEVSVRVLVGLVLLGLSLVLMAGVNGIIRSFVEVGVNYADQGIAWLRGDVLSTGIGLVRDMVFSYGFNGLAYLPIGMLVASVGIHLFFLLWRKDGVLSWLILGSVLSLFIIPILLGHIQYYRSCSVFGLFVSFGFMLVVDGLRANGWQDWRGLVVRRGAVLLGVLLVVWQVGDLNHWFRGEVLRDREEKLVAFRIGGALEAYGSKKPVVFVGEYELSLGVRSLIWARSDSLAGWVHDRFGEAGNPEEGLSYLIVQTSVTSVFNGSTGVYYDPLGPSEVHRYLGALGIGLVPDRGDLYPLALSVAKEGYLITESEDLIVVDLSEVVLE